MLEEVANSNKNVHYFDISKIISSKASFFDDKYHTLEDGNNIVSEELKTS